MEQEKESKAGSKYMRDTSRLTIISVVFIVMILALNGCTREKVTLPEILTDNISFVTFVSAQCAGNVFTDGGSEVTSRGICWSISHGPTILDNKTENGSGTGKFTGSLTGLTEKTKYYVRAYATNKQGTAYGYERSFRTQEGTAGTVTDIDGNMYETIVIGTQTWMTENLKTTKFNDGADIQLVTDGSQWSGLSTPSYCWYGNDINNKDPYGALYNWFAVETGKICPTGWHVPSDVEVIKLIRYNFTEAGNVTGVKLRESGTDHWVECPPWSESTNESGFAALGGANRKALPSGNFGVLKVSGTWWTASETVDGASAYMFFIESCSDYVSLPTSDDQKDGRSVRCIMDSQGKN